MKNKWRVLAGILCAAFLCTACSEEETKKVQIGKYEEQEYQPKLDALRPGAYGSVSNLRLEPGTYISIIGKDNTSDFWKSVEAGAKQAAADINKMMGYKGDKKVKVVYSAPSKDEDVNEQVNILDEELSRNPAALGIAIIDADACEVQFDLAADNGIPVVMYDSGSGYTNAVSMIGTDNKEAGRTAGNKLGSAVNGSGKVALFMPDSKSTAAMQREEGIKEALAADYEEVEIADSYHGNELEQRIRELAKEVSEEGAKPETDEGSEVSGTDDAAGTDAAEAGESQENTDTQADAAGQADTKSAEEKKAQIEQMTELDMIKHILQENPDLAGCVTGNERVTKLVLQAVEELKLENLKIVAFDGGKKALDAVKQGRIEGLVIQNPFGMGYAAVVAAARAVLQEANEAAVDSGYIWVTKDNLEEKSIKELLY